MPQDGTTGYEMIFGGSGQQTVAVAADAHIALFQMEVSVAVDTNVSVTFGATQKFSSDIKATASPVQLFFLDLGMGRGTGVKGDDMVIQLGAQGVVYTSFIIYTDD